MVGYGVAQTLVQVLKQCGDNLTRENIMKQAASLKDFRTEVLLPGIKINTSPTDFAPISQLQLMRFKGERWELFGDIISADVGGLTSFRLAHRPLTALHGNPRRHPAGVFFCRNRMDNRCRMFPPFSPQPKFPRQ